MPAEIARPATLRSATLPVEIARSATARFEMLRPRTDAAEHYANGVGPNARFWNPHSLALDGAGYLYVADGNNEVRKILLSTAEVTQFAGSGAVQLTDGVGASASFNSISALVSGGPGVLYVADNRFARSRFPVPT